MASSSPFPARPLPRGLIVAGSLAILFHLFALGVLVLAAPSGPWYTPLLPMSTPADPPEFVKAVGDSLSSFYLQPLHLTHNYHFESNRTENPSVYFEVKLTDAEGKPLKSLKFPDANSNFWVRHRQTLLAQGLGNDQLYNLPQSVRNPSPLVRVWFSDKAWAENKLEDKIERDLQDIRSKGGTDMFFQPSDWSLLLVQSYARYLCRTNGAAKAEIIRHSREPILPVIVLPLADELRTRGWFDRTFNTFVANYGEQSGGR